MIGTEYHERHPVIEGRVTCPNCRGKGWFTVIDGLDGMDRTYGCFECKNGTISSSEWVRLLEKAIAWETYRLLGFWKRRKVAAPPKPPFSAAYLRSLPSHNQDLSAS